MGWWEDQDLAGLLLCSVTNTRDGVAQARQRDVGIQLQQAPAWTNMYLSAEQKLISKATTYLCER